MTWGPLYGAGEVMIINHRYRFIFLKTRKTASTSIEIALSRFCDSNDVITPISKKDERIRQELGFPGPQNYKIPIRYYDKIDWLNFLAGGHRKRFSNHSVAQYIRNNIGKGAWSSYFKFCFERNPFDKAISRYYWSTSEPRPGIGEYLQSAPVELLSNWGIYTINDHISIDFVGRYEELHDHLAFLKDKLCLPQDIVLPNAKGGHRKNREHYSKVLDSKARARIETVCAKEMVYLNYHWNEV